jgi:hypothetical protein
MTAFTLFQAGAPPLGWYHYLAGLLLLAWAGAVAYVAWRLRAVRQRYDPSGDPAVPDAHGVPDQPTATDTLQMEVAPALAGILRHNGTRAPYTVALSGSWGSGKSSVMRQLERQLGEGSYWRAGRRRSFKAVTVNVWHFNNEDYLLTAFLQRVLAQLTDYRFVARRVWRKLLDLGFWPTVFRTMLLALALPVLLFIGTSLVRDLAHNFVKQREDQGAPLSGWLRSGYGQLSRGYRYLQGTAPFYVVRHSPKLLPSSGSPPEGKPVADARSPGLPPGLARAVTILTLLGSVGAALFKLPGLVQPLLQLIPYQQKYEAAEGDAGFRQRYQNDFRDIIQDATGTDLVIFVDDIDRIPGARVLELLETLNFIVTCATPESKGAGLFFVLAMNVPEVVRVLGDALDPHSRLPTDAARQQLAARYLAKMVDLTVRIPSLQGRDIKSLFEVDQAADQALKS